MENKQDNDDVRYLTISELLLACAIFIIGLVFAIIVAVVFVRSATAEVYKPATQEQILKDCQEMYLYTAKQINELQTEYNACSKVASRLGLEIPEITPIDLLALPEFTDAGTCSAHLGAAGYTRVGESNRLEWCYWQITQRLTGDE